MSAPAYYELWVPYKPSGSYKNNIPPFDLLNIRYPKPDQTISLFKQMPNYKMCVYRLNPMWEMWILEKDIIIFLKMFFILVILTAYLYIFYLCNFILKHIALITLIKDTYTVLLWYNLTWRHQEEAIKSYSSTWNKCVNVPTMEIGSWIYIPSSLN